MTSLERALKDIVTFLEARRVPYMVIGGIANFLWGAPRSTLDVDITVHVSDSFRPEFLDQVARVFRLRTKSPVEFVRETRVLPLLTASGVPVDLMFALLSYEEQAIGRAVRKSFGEVAIQVCTAEDLIIHKIISDRPQDQADVLAIIERQKHSIERAYLEPIISAMARELGKPEIEEAYRRAVS